MSALAVYRFHGLVVRAEGAWRPDPVEALLAPFKDAYGGAADLVLAIHPTPSLAPPQPADAPPAFVHGDVRAWRDGAGALRVESPRAALAVHSGGARVEGAFVPPADAGALDLLAHVEVFLAFAAALHARGIVHLHAASLVASGGAPLLVPGTGGCGKSTLATALVAAGHAYLGDDVVFVARRDGGLRLLGFPRAFHLAERSASAVPATLPHLAAGGATSAGKRRLDAAEAFPGAARAEAGAPAVILFPDIVDAESSRLEPLDPAEALARLLASSLFAATRLGSPAQRALLADVAGGAPAYAARLGRDLLREAVPTAARLSAEVGLQPGR